MNRLILDAQVFQTPAWHRGMGKYSLELIRSLAADTTKTRTWDEIIVLISGRHAIDGELEKELLQLPKVNLKMLDLAENNILNPLETVAHNRAVVDEYMADLDGGATYLILSLMQGEISPVFPSDKNVHRAVLFYDLIPLMFHKVYLQNPITRKEYITKISELIMADSFLAISKTVANDLAIYLGIAPSAIVSIDGGPIKHDTKKEKIDVPLPYILMPTGNDLRKNNRRAIEAFKIFNKRHNNKYTLVITSFFKEEEIKELSRLSDHVVFTGNISGAQLNYLYDHTDLLLFPSEYEGLGLPALEALEHNKPVACSDIPVLREISKTAFSYFDYASIHSIADGIESGLSKKVKAEEVTAILRKYSWKNTAETTRRMLLRSLDHPKQNERKLLVVSGDASMANRVGKLLLQSHAYMQQLFDIAYYQETRGATEYEPRLNTLPYIAQCQMMGVEVPIFTEYEDRLPLYHIANRPQDARLLLGVLAKSGIVVLHDNSLADLWQAALEQGLISSERYEVEIGFNKMYETHWLASLLVRQKGVVVFSRQLADEVHRIVKKAKANTKVRQLSLPVNGLVYPEISPDALHAVTAKDIAKVDDMEYEAILSYGKQFTTDKTDVSTDTLLAQTELAKYHLAGKPQAPDYRAFVSELSDFVLQVEKGDKK